MEENLNFSLRPYKSKSFSNVVTWNIFGLQVFYYCKGAHNKMSDPIGLQMNRQPVIRVLVVEIVGFGAEGAEKNRISAPKAPKIFRDFGIDLGVGIDLTRLTGIPVTGICDAEHKHLYHLPKPFGQK